MKIALDGVRKDVGIVRTADGFVVTIDDRRHIVSDVSLVAGTIAFLIDQASHVAHVSQGRNGLDISIGGRTYAHTRDEVDTDRPVGAAGEGRLEAPMPGSIVAVNVKTGDTVKAGDPLVVLESMKMHNELLSPATGTVKKVHCKSGEQVAYGQVLVEIGAK
ncbi:MAG: biotin/lipoyl-binding protein [Candidatus Krumholzibacteria bacterium]|nr:biotin/lipoyl-binding protein [Candidatus Krumholzibacteria bacterium]MDH5271368.1 biotin/lipoyl-binding protein [Candidatus Krumholzibacteria bacterium]